MREAFPAPYRRLLATFRTKMEQKESACERCVGHLPSDSQNLVISDGWRPHLVSTPKLRHDFGDSAGSFCEPPE
jgi:hypothetical protein